MSQDVKFGIKLILSLVSITSFLIGMLAGIGCSSCVGSWNCKPKNIVTMINIPARLGCEMVKERDWVR